MSRERKAKAAKRARKAASVPSTAAKIPARNLAAERERDRQERVAAVANELRALVSTYINRAAETACASK